MKHYLIIISFLLISPLTFYSQIKMSMKSLYETRTIITPTVLKNMNQRPLLVELLEVNEKLIAKLSKSKKPKKSEKNAVIKDFYVKFINDYNNFIKIAVKKHWKLNTDISFKTTSEIDELNKLDKKYSVLFYSEHLNGNPLDGHLNYFNHFNEASPGLRYSRIEKRDVVGRHPDYSFFIPQPNTRKNTILLSDLIITIKLMHNHLNATLKNKSEKNFSFKRFAQKQASENCLNFQNKTNLLVKNTDIKETLFFKHNNKHPKRKLILKNDAEISELIINEKEEFACLLFLYGFPTNENTGGQPTPKYFKSFIDLSTGEIYSIYGEKKMQNWKPKLTFQDLNKTFKECN